MTVLEIYAVQRQQQGHGGVREVALQEREREQAQGKEAR